MVCIEKRPYTLYGRLATLHFRYLTCLLDRGHIILQIKNSSTLSLIIGHGVYDALITVFASALL